MIAWLDWLAALPGPLLYLAIAVAAFAENVFPPLPADTVIALGAFVVARGDGSATAAWLATMIGNVGGAMTMFALGRRLGVSWFTTRFPRIFPVESTQRVAADFRRRGVMAVAISRFLPGVRAVVPPVAGASGMTVASSAMAMALASGVWYGIVCVVAFRAGANAEHVLAQIAAQQRVVAVAAAVIAIIAVVRYLHRRRRAA